MSSNTQLEKLLNVKESAALLGISTVTMWRKIKQQEIGFYRIGSRVLLSKENHILPFLAKCENKSKSSEVEN